MLNLRLEPSLKVTDPNDQSPDRSSPFLTALDPEMKLYRSKKEVPNFRSSIYIQTKPEK